MADILSPSISSILNEIDGELSLWELVKRGDLDIAYLEELGDSLKKMRTASHDLHSPGGANKVNVSDILTYMASADAATYMLSDALDKTTNNSNAGQSVINNASSFVSNILKPWLVSLWKGVWAIFQKMTNVKGWKISGQLGSTMLGLAKSTIEISFD